ncbi:hypothetical protein K437DRAFT_235803 [Tilletiaria anomala UBC 951]|uniref:Ribosome assembly factor mrt4 n=1 Tax=Tilletiaria anomala (strain ATCC 24038 / CBS 436.72 / UBC 951) TaxID=1037660 RepID=A0A066VYU3_TILAU|nr:uncharacterized protein K437DRAFT_235803 [Tilletiaria anomala UBC 951]KDN45443.1 hypothetical protein K437DRAFT_235803 [Tilletiaria anomala UBC 951]
MPRARRNKVVTLTKTAKKTRADKESLIDKVRDAAQQYSFVWLFGIGNMRNAYLKEVRQLWEGSRLFFGKLGIMRKALGTEEGDEIRTGISALSNKLAGSVGLLFTDSPPAEVQEWFKTYSREDFARAGNKASETVVLPEGPVMMHVGPVPEALPHSIEPQLRQLGMPTELKRGVPTLLREFTVCKKGSRLTKEAAQILKHLLIMQAEFRIIPLAYWSSIATEGKAEGTVHELELTPEQKELIEQAQNDSSAELAGVGGKKTKKGSARNGRSPKKAAEDAEMDAEEDEEDDDDVSLDDGDKVEESMMLPAELR